MINISCFLCLSYNLFLSQVVDLKDDAPARFQLIGFITHLGNRFGNILTVTDRPCPTSILYLTVSPELKVGIMWLTCANPLLEASPAGSCNTASYFGYIAHRLCSVRSYNDSRVMLAETPPADKGYIYFFKRLSD